MFYEAPSNYLKELPERLQSVAQIIAIANSVNPELDALNEKLANAVADTAISTALADGLLRWEKILGVSVPLDSSPEARREALTAKLMTRPPINLSVLKSIIEAYMGLEVELTVDGYTVLVKYRGESRIADLTPLFATVYDAIPADMLLEISYRYLIWEELDGLTLDFDGLDAVGAAWDAFEKGEWIYG